MENTFVNRERTAASKIGEPAGKRTVDLATHSYDVSFVICRIRLPTRRQEAAHQNIKTQKLWTLISCAKTNNARQ